MLRRIRKNCHHNLDNEVDSNDLMLLLVFSGGKKRGTTGTLYRGKEEEEEDLVKNKR